MARVRVGSIVLSVDNLVPPDADYSILADPEGNRFCVVDTTR
jgi:hypothetical protein